MRILIIEDQSEKYSIIETEMRAFFQGITLDVVQADCLAVANKLIYEDRFDLVIVDLMVPLRAGGEPEDISEEIISTIQLSDHNRGANIIALSGFEDLVAEQRDRFTDAGIILVHYDDQTETWKKSIEAALSRIGKRMLFDFVVICALDKERNAFRATSAEIGELRNIRGLDCLPMNISGLRGVCVKLPRMGLVDASIITSRAIERFSPKIVAMSGICAGFVGASNIGSLIVADPCWEYQAGKWADDGFKIEHYDVCLEVNTRTILSQFISRVGNGMVYKNDLLEDAVVFQEILLAPMATGSAVIASSERLAKIQEQHRKIAALDMEMYGVLKAAQLSALNPIAFGAKTVVDLADSAKGDQYHEYGSILSARFVLDAIVELHKNISSEQASR